MDKTKLPNTTKFIIDNYLAPIFPRASYESLVLIIMFNVSKMLCYNRVTIDDSTLRLSNTFPNIYTISFSKSGSGKDKAIRSMKSIMRFFEDGSKKQFSEYIKATKEALEADIEFQGMNTTKANEYRKEHAPRWLKMNIDSNSTVEGYMEQRKAFEVARFGCTHWMDSEIFDTIRSNSPGSVLFKKANKESFDHGDNQDKVIKGNKEPCDIEGVPHLINLAGAIDNDEQSSVFKSFFDLGYARRTLVVMNSDDEFFNKMSLSKRKELSAIAKDNQKLCEKLLEDIFNRTKKDMKFEYGGNKTYHLSDEAVEAYFNYDEDCKEKAFGVSNMTNTGIVVEIEGRAWKMIKLAACISAQESSTFVIDREHVEMAIYLTDFYGEHFAKFYQIENITVGQKFVDFIRSNPGCTKTKIRSQKFMPRDQRGQTVLMREMLDEGGINEILLDTSEILVKRKVGQRQNAVGYKIMEKPRQYDEMVKFWQTYKDEAGFNVLMSGQFKEEDTTKFFNIINS